MASCVASTYNFVVIRENLFRKEVGTSTHSHYCGYYRIKVIVLRLPFIQPDDDVNGEGLHGSEKLPLV